MNEETKEAYPLDEAMIALVEEHQRHTLMLNGALNLFCRQQGLAGAWTVAANGREIVRAPQMHPQLGGG